MGERAMKRDADVIVIGGGIGGVAAGALLAHGGRHVILLERNGFLGGRCTSYDREGFVIDAFVHMVGRCEKGPFGEIMRRMGRPGAIEWWHATPDCRPVCFIDEERYPYPDASFCSREELLEYYRGFGLAEQEVRAALRLQDTILEMSYEETFALDDVPYSRWVKRFTTHPALLALEHQKALLYCVVTLNEASAGEFIRMMQNCQRDANVGYPKGGCIRIPEAMAEVIRDHGGSVRIATSVEKILIKGGRVEGVRLRGGEVLRAPVVVSNAGIRETVLRLAGEGLFPSDYVKRVQGLTTGKLVEETPMGMVYLKLALDAPVIRDPMILRNVRTGAIQGSVELMEGLVQDRPPSGYQGINTFIPVTSVMDPNLAPPGKQLVNFFGLAPVASKDWQVWVDYHLGYLFRLYPEVKEHVMWYDMSTLGGISRFSGRFHPDIIGIAQSVGQTGEKRPSPATPVEGLYLVGADVGKDNIGTELAAESAVRLTEMLS
jgi:phytoene dehydrogenase-like protein